MVAGDVRQGQCQVHHNSLIITENKKHNEQHLGGVSIVGSHLLLGKNIVAKLFNSPLALGETIKSVPAIVKTPHLEAFPRQ